MDRQPDPNHKTKKSIGGDLIIPVAALGFTLYYFYTIYDSPWTAQVSAFFIGSILIALVIIFLIISIRSVLKREADLGLGNLVSPPSFIPKRLALLGLTLGYIVAIEWAGFTLTSFVFLSAAMLLLGDGRAKGFVFGLSFVLSLGGYLLFVVAFETRFPPGPFEALMKMLF